MSASVQYVTDPRGGKRAVLMTVADYENLMEDMEDLTTIVERKNEPAIPHEDFIRELREDGVLPD